jgi:hypothetical protein
MHFRLCIDSVNEPISHISPLGTSMLSNYFKWGNRPNSPSTSQTNRPFLPRKKLPTWSTLAPELVAMRAALAGRTGWCSGGVFNFDLSQDRKNTLQKVRNIRQEDGNRSSSVIVILSCITSFPNHATRSSIWSRFLSTYWLNSLPEGPDYHLL